MVEFQLCSTSLSPFLFFKSSSMPPKAKPTQSTANRGVSVARGGRGARGGRSGGRGGRATTATVSQVDQEEVSMPSAELEAMKAELEMLRKTAQAKKAAEATRRRDGEFFFQFLRKH